MDWLTFREPVNTWTHLLWSLLSVPATLLLWRHGRGDLPKQLSLLVFGLGLISCFGCSALYHGVNTSPAQIEVYATFDYAGIYLLIAGTCTPIVFTLGRGWRKWSILTGVWLAALAGIVTRLLLDHTPRWLNPCIYLVMGWALASCHPQLVRAVSARPVRLVWLGGLFYTLGAFCYLSEWPDPWRGVVGSHGLLHFFGMAGSLTHYWFVLKYVAPYQRRRPVAAVTANVGNQNAPVPV